MCGATHYPPYGPGNPFGWSCECLDCVRKTAVYEGPREALEAWRDGRLEEVPGPHEAYRSWRR